MTSCQESRNPSSSGNCCFSSSEEFSSTKIKQTEVSEAMRSSSKQNKALRYSWSDVFRHQSFVTRSTSLGVAKAGNLKLDFMAKSIEIHFFLSLKTFLDVMEIPKPKKPFGRINTLSSPFLHVHNS